MRFPSILVMALSVAACGSGAIPPTAPTPPAPPPAAPPPVPDPPTPPPPASTPDETGSLWVKVIADPGGACLVGATVDVIVAGSVVQSGVQAAPVPHDPCDYWSDGGGIIFVNLPITEVRLRATASGYVTREVTARPAHGGPAVLVYLQQPK